MVTLPNLWTLWFILPLRSNLRVVIVVADSGSTKCDWLLVDDKGTPLFEKQRTKGLNPAILLRPKLRSTIAKNKVMAAERQKATHVYFYGAGCGTPKPTKMLKEVLEEYFPNAVVEVKEDTYAAAYAAVGAEMKPAIICILGTGSNCSFFDGEKLHQRVTSLGYAVMDDASGNYFGRRLIRDYYFSLMPENLKISFSERYDLESDAIKAKLYKKPNPNTYLASFAEFMFLNKESEYIENLIKSGIREFAKTMIFQFKEYLEEHPVHFAGSIAFFAQEEIRAVGKEMGFKVGVFERRPIEGLIRYHVNNLNNKGA